MSENTKNFLIMGFWTLLVCGFWALLIVVPEWLMGFLMIVFLTCLGGVSVGTLCFWISLLIAYIQEKKK